ncbi:lysophospholipid acyltransferase family protein [Williamsia sp.]|uniref:lysophospholipid acyltransferase family protein n=1 Tax=Williamsia sp. TaxID=1872085 RepID=UPI002F92D2CD
MEIDISEADQVYAHYLEHQQDRRAALLKYGYLALKYRPRVRFDAADGKGSLNELTKSGVRLVISINHISESDPYVVAAAAFRSPLRFLIGRTRILAKDELFVDDELRRKIDSMGGIPVFRAKNHGTRVAAAAGLKMIDTCVERMSRGDSIAVFPEGTCNLDDPTIVAPVGSGVAHIAVRAKNAGCRVALVNVGLSYPDDSHRKALVVMGTPIELDAGARPAAVARQIRLDLQRVVDLANA